ncbi:TetR family transcriptional regulator [Amycolatopsis mediterranei S699]|uniref:TetR family transcriptional regulator n=2 Tax=Amycolatopsis mediterranei TaxID=33910 RepID=A0A0H3D587_AMYMU|nr:TetR family transcriptional regulator [Amycolatopsis mediterranei]ADJ45427.1 TetR family transcriptional regulator [Amycolatopsis mediterranei U32]AFO77139.1 TetR family transcriptional regulator [Amycolatopsis mediterranei S699]AGT84267.1 TetR family transcriptional regulator [Amycolatopsis mediterranei RB]KDO06006.1 TetR family transcriptional regulator [Amycolatopsis mediterranei]KDU88853.1 TetR family transcriptional regulator [Amycolatopsis mediterranei]
MSQSMFMRARRPEQKEQRRVAILAAARELALESGVRNVSLGSVATAVGLAKSNVTRYFGTREEIYLELASACWRDWADEVARRLAAGNAVVDVLAETLAERTLFCDLLGHTATSLEHNVSVPAARDFKRLVLGVLTELGAAVARACPELTEGEGFELAGAASGLAGMVYPAANPPPTLREVYAQNPDLAAACLPFLPTLKRALAALAAGLPSLR